MLKIKKIVSFLVPVITSLVLTVVLIFQIGCESEPDTTLGDVTEIFEKIPEPGMHLLLPLSETDEAGQPLEPLMIEVLDNDLNPRVGLGINVIVDRGGGSLSDAELRTDNLGRCSFEWILGPAPVLNRLVITADDLVLKPEIQGVCTEPRMAEPFGGVHDFLSGQEIFGTTEDLAFSPDGSLVLGIPGGLMTIAPDGTPALMNLTGDPIEGPLGIAYDRAGNLWVADSESKVLRRVSPDGEVTTVLTGDGTNDLAGPNYVAIGPNGRVYLSDPCLGEIIQYNPETEEIEHILEFDLAAVGGPNGMAFDSTYSKMFIATENTSIQCQHSYIPFDEPLSALISVDILSPSSGFGEKEIIVSQAGLFGDGLAFDQEGNLYVIFDQQENFQLAESAVWVLPEGGTDLVKFLAVEDRIMANLAFGQGAFGETVLHISLLTIPPFTDSSARGAERSPVGIPGLNLLP